MDDREYEDLNDNGRFDPPETWEDLNGDGLVQRHEFNDENFNGDYDHYGEVTTWEDRDGNGIVGEREWTDLNGNDQYDGRREEFIDLNNDGQWQPISDKINSGPNNTGEDRKLDPGLPRLAAEMTLGDGAEGCSVSPDAHNIENASSQFGDFLSAIGLGAVANLFQMPPAAAGNGGGCLRAYSPGYSFEPSAPQIQREGGIEMIAELNVPNLIDKARFDFDLGLPKSGLAPNFTAVGSADAISAGGFLLPVTGDEMRLELAHHDGTVTFGMGGRFNLLGYEFVVPFTKTVYGSEGENGDYFLQMLDDGLVGRLAISPPANNPLAAAGPVQLDGSFALEFDTRPATASLAITVTDGRIVLPGNFALENASFSIRVNSDGTIDIDNVRADSSFFGQTIDFDGQLTIERPGGVPRVKSGNLTASVSVGIVLGAGFAEAHGSAAIQVGVGEVTGSFTGSGFILGVPSPEMSGDIESNGCLSARFTDPLGILHEQKFNLPGGSCGEADSQVQLDVGISKEGRGIEYRYGSNPWYELDNPVRVAEQDFNVFGSPTLRIPVTLTSLAGKATKVEADWRIEDLTGTGMNSPC